MKIGKQARRTILNSMFIFGTFGAVVFFALRSGDIRQIGQALRSVDFWWLLGGMACFLVHAAIEGTTLHVFLVFQKIRSSLSSCLLIGLIGMYYSSITPAATGGQPMQVFQFKRRGIPPGFASSALAVKFFCWQCALLLLGGVAWLMKPGLVAASTNQAVWLVRVGFFFNSIAVVAVILLAISRNLVRAMIIFLVNLAFKLRLIKDKAQTSSRWDAALMDFHDSVEFVTRHPGQFIVLFLMALTQVTALMSAVYFIYRSFSLRTAPYADLLTLQLMLYIAASFTPLPGASGAQEGGFYLFFSGYFDHGTIFAALFVWRFVTFYLSIILGFVALMIDGAGSVKRTGEAKEAVPERRDQGDELKEDRRVKQRDKAGGTFRRTG